MKDGPDGLGVRAFRALLHLYPRWFREAHGDEMTELFRARLTRARGVGGRLRLWRRVLGDLAATLLAFRGRGESTSGTSGMYGTGRGIMGGLMHDVRHAARRLRRTPLFTVSAVVLLAVGIGANTAVFTVVNAVLLRPPPFAHPERVVWVYQDSDDGEPSSDAYPAYRDMAASGAFESVTATSTSSATLETADQRSSVEIEYTTDSYLRVLGLSPTRGRWFSPEENVAGGPLAAVVSYATWRNRFGSDPGIVGRTVRLNGHPVTVVGVGPEKLDGSVPPVVTDFWLSISATVVGGRYRVANLEDRGSHWYFVLARLHPGRTVAQAQSAMTALAARLAESYPELDRGRGITVFPAKDVRMHPSEDGKMRSAAALLMSVVGLVLLLACGNLANLLLVRGLGRSGEVAVRRALGAGTGRVARLFLLESALLSVTGGVAGVLLGTWALGFLPRLPLPYPFSATLDLHPDHPVILFAVGLVVATAVVFGLAPALRSTRSNVAATLRDEARTASMGRGTARLSRFLVALQVAASLVLVLGAGLLSRSLSALQHVDTGVDADRVAYLRTSFDQAGLSVPEIRVTLSELQSRLASVPGVTSVGTTSRLPAQSAGTSTTVVEGYQPSSGTDAVELNAAVVSPQYFPTVGISIVAGRNFGRDDVAGSERVVVVNEAAARRFWGGPRRALGGRIRSQGSPDAWRTVVGVVEDAPVSSLSERNVPMFYGAVAQSSLSSAYLMVRTDGNPASVLAPARAALGAVRASLPVDGEGTLRDHFGAALSGPRTAAAAMGLFSLLAVFLASLGIYAVVAFGVARRSAELGIRMALGAGRGGVLRMVVGEVTGTVLLGLVAGIAFAVAAAPMLGGALFGVRPRDPVTFLGSVTLLLAVSALAAYLPARRAARVDPVSSLRV